MDQTDTQQSRPARNIRFLAVLVATIFTLALAALSLGLIDAPAAHAQSNRCTISVQLDSPDSLQLEFQPRSDLSFNSFPEWAYRISGNGIVPITDQFDEGGKGVEVVSVSKVPAGTYLIEAQAKSLCSVTVTYGGGGEVNLPPSASLDCPSKVEAGDRIALSATSSDPEGAELKERWRAPNGVDFEGNKIEWIAEVPEARFVFFVDDGENAPVSYICNVAVVASSGVSTPSSVPATSTATPEPTATPTPEIRLTSIPIVIPPTVIEVPAPDPTAVPAPSSTPDSGSAVPVPDPTSAAADPAPSSSSAVPAPDPTSDSGSVEPPPGATPQGAVEPAPDSTPDPGSLDPQPDPTSEPAGSQDSALSLNGRDIAISSPSTAADSSIVKAGKLTYSHPIELMVGDVDRVVVMMVGVDLNEVAERGYDQDNELVLVSEPDEVRIEVPIYGVLGEVELTLDLRGDSIEFADTDAGPTRSIRFAHKQLTQTDWDIRAVRPGTVVATIRSEGASRADATNLFTEDELRAADPADLDLDLTFQIVTGERVDWLSIALWKWLFLLPLALLPVAFVNLAPTLRGEPSPSSSPVAPLSSAGAQDIGLVLSGGGMRATAFGAGVAAFLADSGAYERLAQIASVSGGSLTNAWLAGYSARTRSRPRSAEDLRPLAQAITRRGLALERSAMMFGAALLVALVWIWIVVLRAAPNGAIGSAVATAVSLGFVLGAWGLFTWLGVRLAIKRWVPAVIEIDDDTTMSDLGVQLTQPAIDHVITATATSSEHVHVSQHSALIEPPISELLKPSGDRSMLGKTASITVSEAVRASSAFPGLPTVVLDAADLGLGERNGKLTLWDGGTIDNLGHIGATVRLGDEHDDREWLTRWGSIAQWFVVDASAVRAKAAIRRRKTPNRILNLLHLGLFADLAGLAGSSSTETTQSSVRAVKEHFEAHRNGVYLHLTESPFDLCVDAVLRDTTPENRASANDAINFAQSHRQRLASFVPASERADRALNLLVQLCQVSSGSAQADWDTNALDNPRVATTLHSLRGEQVAGLLHHGWVLAMTKAVLDLGWPLVAPELFVRDRFETMVADD